MSASGAADRGSGIRDPNVLDVRAVIANVLAGAKAPCITSSFQAECIVLTHMLLEATPQIPVLFLDTVHHFTETYTYRDEMAAAWKMNLINLKAAEPNPGLWQTSTEQCCAVHKVGPLFSALEQYDVWFTALRREQSPSRANLQEVEPFRLPSGKMIQRVSPLASWTTRDVWGYAKEHAIRLLPLYEAGYTSIGCEPCTTPPLDPDNPRSGRWQGQKLECGIHIQAGGGGKAGGAGG
jgi:phosphoadenosine phosphosulfate reductase